MSYKVRETLAIFIGAPFLLTWGLIFRIFGIKGDIILEDAFSRGGAKV